MSCRLQIVSDLHLEILPNRSLLPPLLHSTFDSRRCAPSADSPFVLALLGDIGNPFDPFYRKFLIDLSCSSEWTDILVVAGNHEFYGNEVNSTRERIATICDDLPNVVFLDAWTGEESFRLERFGIRFVGSTLWTHVEDSSVDLIERSLSDYIRIRVDSMGRRERLRVRHTNGFHLTDRQHIESQVSQAFQSDETCVILSHHCPVKTLRGGMSTLKRDKVYMESGYVNAFERTASQQWLRPDRGAQLWCYGHTHNSLEGSIASGTRIVSNQFGYRYDGEKTGYIPGKIIPVFGFDEQKMRGCADRPRPRRHSPRPRLRHPTVSSPLELDEELEAEESDEFFDARTPHVMLDSSLDIFAGIDQLEELSSPPPVRLGNPTLFPPPNRWDRFAGPRTRHQHRPSSAPPPSSAELLPSLNPGQLGALPSPLHPGPASARNPPPPRPPPPPLPPGRAPPPSQSFTGGWVQMSPGGEIQYDWGQYDWGV